MASGSILKRAGKRGTSYLVRVDVGTDPVTGKRIQVAETYATRREAERRKTEWLAEVDRGTALRPDQTTISDLLESWLTTVIAHRVRETTLAGYRHSIRHHLVPRLGTIKVQRLTTARVQACYAEMLSSGVGSRTVQQCHQRLAAALDQAVRWQIVATNAARHAEPPKARAKRGSIWDAEQLRRFLDAAELDSLRVVWVLLATTGMRQREVLGLRWGDLDASRSTIHVRRSVVLYQGRPLLQEPKTDAGQRSVLLPQEAVQVLKEHRSIWLGKKLRAAPEVWGESDFITCTANGSMMDPNHLSRNFARIIAAADLPRIRIHDLRHTHASLLLGNGVPVTAVSQRLGHASPAITMQTYAHVLRGQDETAVAVLTQLLSTADTGSIDCFG